MTEQVFRQASVIGGGHKTKYMKHIIVHRQRELVLNEPLPENVGVFFSAETYTAKVFDSKVEAEKFEKLLDRQEEDTLKPGTKVPLDKAGLMAFADNMKIPYKSTDTTATIKSQVDKWIDESNYPVMWQAGQSLTAGDVIQIDGIWYRVLQSHVSQSDWHPKTVPALFVETSPPGEIPEWKQPAGAHDAYKKGDKVMFNGSVYESLIDANVWSPTVYAQGWKRL